MGGGIEGDIFSIDGQHYVVINEGVQMKAEGDDWCRGILYKPEGDTSNENVMCMKGIEFFEVARRVYTREEDPALQFSAETVLHVEMGT